MPVATLKLEVSDDLIDFVSYMEKKIPSWLAMESRANTYREIRFEPRLIRRRGRPAAKDMWKSTALNRAYSSIWAIPRMPHSSTNGYFIEDARRDFDFFIKRLRKEMVNEYWLSRGVTRPPEKLRQVKNHRPLEVHLSETFKKAPSSAEPQLEKFPLPTKSEALRRWGIEIELAGARGVQTPDGWDRKYDGSLRSAYSNECPCNSNDDDYCPYCEDGYHEDCDDCGYSYEDDTAEIVSPILYYTNSKGVRQICDEARFEPQNDSAGVHVHVEAKDLSPRQLGALLYAYGIIEPILESSYHRTTREYCHDVDTRHILTGLTEVKTWEKKNTLEPNFYSLDRYRSLNLQSIHSHGTVEFRAMGPEYDADYLLRWASFCRHLVEAAKKNVRQKEWEAVKTFEDILRIFRKYGISEQE